MAIDTNLHFEAKCSRLAAAGESSAVHTLSGAIVRQPDGAFLRSAENPMKYQ